MILVALFIVLSILDTVTTEIGLRRGAREGSPLPARILKRYGRKGFHGTKAVGSALVVAYLANPWLPPPSWLYWALDGTLAVVVVNNCVVVVQKWREGKIA